jgi:hypothetical protein
MTNSFTVITYCHEKHRPWMAHWIKQLNAQKFRGFDILFIMHNWSDNKNDEYIASQILSLDDDLRKNFRYLSFRSRPVIGEVINFAINNVNTTYVAHWDVDDPVHPDRLMLQNEYIQQHPETDFVAARMVGFYGEPTKEMQQLNYYEPNELDTDVVEHQSIYDCLLRRHRNCLGHTTMIYKAQTMRDIGGFSLSDVKIDGLSPDYETWKKALRAGYKFYRLPQLCALWRLDSSSIRF